MKMAKINVGIVGCGVISEAYLKAAPQFPVLNMRACADIDPKAAQVRAKEFDLRAYSVEALLVDSEIDVVLNLTTPQHHVSVGLAAIAAGKHVYSEKPLAISFDEAERLVAAAKVAGLRVGCAPDTFLGAAHQTARRVLDSGDIGEIVAGTAFMMLSGHESWHPNPDFYYRPGGGPLMDMGPYYLTALINMIGPIDSVVGMAKSSFAHRIIGSGPRKNETFKVNTDTHVSGILKFANGAMVTLTTSFDVQKHGHSPIELYGTKGSMLVSDPNKFDGEIQISAADGDWKTAAQNHLYGDGDYRIIGLADMAQAILSSRPHRASLELSLHVLETMLAILTSAQTGRPEQLNHQCERPMALPDTLPFGQLD